MIELHITSTGKSYSPQSHFTIFDEQTKTFPDLASAKAWLTEQYGTCKRQKMYHDDAEGKAVHSGYIYGFKNCDWSHSPVEKWLQQDWVSFTDVTREAVVL